MNLFGDWEKAEKLFGNRIAAAETINRASQVGLRRALAFFEGQIKKNIQSGGSLADKPFAPNKPATIRIKGSDKPLMDTNQMMGSVHPVIVQPGKKGFVGLKRGTIHKKTSEDVSDIAAIHEFGAIDGDGKGIQERPFIGPVLEKFKDEAGDKFLEGFGEVLSGE